MKRRILTTSLAAFAALMVVIQLVPNRLETGPVTQEPAWDPSTRELAQRACFDCHSNQGELPWYGRVAPVSWVVTHHIDEGREHLNFSEMDRPQEEAHEAAEELLEGEMPPAYYLLTHPEARLSEAETKQLAEGLQRAL